VGDLENGCVSVADLRGGCRGTALFAGLLLRIDERSITDRLVLSALPLKAEQQGDLAPNQAATGAATRPLCVPEATCAEATCARRAGLGLGERVAQTCGIGRLMGGARI
jgi:hypothetical protein